MFLSCHSFPAISLLYKKKKSVFSMIQSLTIYPEASIYISIYLRHCFYFVLFPGTATPSLTLGLGHQCLSGNGKDYRDRIAITESGNTCQRWSTQFPHKHRQPPENYPCKGLDKNYCRNPDGKKRPWCYTTDNTTRWQYCSIPPCPQIASQITGKKCQAWNSVLPHRHNRTANNFPKADLRENYCRNPDNDIAPWYYTTVPTVRWEYCNLQKCDCGGHLASPEPPYSTLDPGTNMTGSNITECIIGNGKDYRGAVTKTRSNRTCQGWSSQEPHHHSYLTPE
nr:PREDICTED: plasminogen-like [Struthio camelus australis]